MLVVDRRLWALILIVILMSTAIVVYVDAVGGVNSEAGPDNDYSLGNEQVMPPTRGTGPVSESTADDEFESDQITQPAPETTPDIAGKPVDEQLYPGSEDQLKRETRAIWSWAGVTATSKANIDELVAQVDAARLNVILLLVYGEGAAYFEPSHSRFSDRKERLPNQSEFSEAGYRDALSYLLAIRDERRSDNDPTNDFEVHAWFAVTLGGAMKVEEGFPVDRTKPFMLNGLFPEFKLKYGRYYPDGDERFIRHDTSVIHQPKFKAYMTDLIGGLVEDYAVDGIHLDHIRTGGICFNDERLDYPGTEYDYPGCQEDYEAWTRETYGREYTLWEDTNGFNGIRDGGSGRVNAWQAQTVSALVKRIHDEVKAIRPEIITSATVGGRSIHLVEEKDESIQGRVTWEWLDQGWVDAAFVMAYTPDTQWVNDTVQLIREATQQESSRAKVFPGLRTFKDDELWSYLIVEQVNSLTRGQLAGRPLEPPARGVVLFRADKLSEEAIAALAEDAFKEPALPFWGK
jgi:uncharacterized lipoprotein YddW (UPF0748 family)